MVTWLIQQNGTLSEVSSSHPFFYTFTKQNHKFPKMLFILERWKSYVVPTTLTNKFVKFIGSSRIDRKSYERRLGIHTSSLSQYFITIVQLRMLKTGTRINTRTRLVNPTRHDFLSPSHNEIVLLEFWLWWLVSIFLLGLH